MTMTSKTSSRVGLLAVALIVAACGGGGAATGTTGVAPSTTMVTETPSTSPAPTTSSTPATTLPDQPSVPTSVAKPSLGDEGAAVVVTGTDIRLLESDPVQVRLLVSAQLPTPCHEATWETEDDGATVTVTLAAESDPAQLCAEVIQEAELEIDLGSFPVGSARDVVLDGELVGDFQT